MPIIHKKYEFTNAISMVVYQGSRFVMPPFLDEKFVEILKNNSKLDRAMQNECFDKATYLATNIQKNDLGHDCAIVIMYDWNSVDDALPPTPYVAGGLIVGASFHALAYFQKDGYYFVCDLNRDQKRPEIPYFRVFLSENQNDLLKLLNAVYGNKELHLIAIGADWADIFHRSKETLLQRFTTQYTLNHLLTIDENSLDEQKTSFTQARYTPSQSVNNANEPSKKQRIGNGITQ